MDGYVYDAAEQPKILMTGKWNESMSYQPCDSEGEPLPGTELKEVSLVILSFFGCLYPLLAKFYSVKSSDWETLFFSLIKLIWNVLQVWRVADAPEDDKYQYTYFTHKLNSFDTAPKKLLPSDSRLRPDRYALEKGDLSKAGSEKSRSLSLSLTRTHARVHTHTQTHTRTH